MKHSYMFVLVLAMLGFSMGLTAQNNALMFDGVNDCVAIGNMTSEVSTSFTVECWFNPSSVAVGSGELATYGRAIFASSTSNDKTHLGFSAWFRNLGLRIFRKHNGDQDHRFGA
jgi:hypothetical protein